MLIIKGLDRKGFKTVDEITDDMFRMKAEDQPIIVTSKLEEILAKGKEEEHQGQQTIIYTYKSYRIRNIIYYTIIVNVATQTVAIINIIIL